MNITKIGSIAAIALALTACNQDKPADNADATKADAPAARELKIATEAAYPPFNDTAPDGKIIGFDVDVINAVCAEINAKCEIVAQDWEGLIPGLNANKYDAIIAGMSITPERLEQVDFSEPYFSNTIVWLSKTDGSFDPNNIKNTILGGQRSTTGAAYIAEKYDGKDGNTVQLYDTYMNAYLDLKAGRNAAVMAEKVSAAEWLKQGQEGFGLVGEEIDNNDNLGIAVRKGDALKEDINAALAKLKESGKLAELEVANFK
ncbi:ABC transporter substrate-binding protein [Moraxella ovis]|uniref:ABC transporter arginine-binding protein 2 n=1 Tax=Moraxella ovis TaxID=29433 RepID=A0A160GGI9_9GAMM|nr:transporter substrate-binding domain-containing protein [Moraxella ovis]ANB92221.1 ABC transporter substrate-binding protein [Moraxella ovis]SPX81502.1 Putative ABC transporter arginine-binding protein 2 precursor [Moraxella ovis]STY88025.1 Putative ABC transporter arginine-binding protein 2 precursor [Moraxella ovis]STZ05915.1 Putative ABC transporter arginine-binding protein 2 precursor [Moraxella ovis]